MEQLIKIWEPIRVISQRQSWELEQKNHSLQKVLSYVQIRWAIESNKRGWIVIRYLNTNNWGVLWALKLGSIF